jgi:hypothetical protein
MEIFAHTGINPRSHELIFGGSKLDLENDDMDLSQYNICCGHTV